MAVGSEPYMSPAVIGAATAAGAWTGGAGPRGAAAKDGRAVTDCCLPLGTRGAGAGRQVTRRALRLAGGLPAGPLGPRGPAGPRDPGGVFTVMFSAGTPAVGVAAVAGVAPGP